MTQTANISRHDPIPPSPPSELAETVRTIAASFAAAVLFNTVVYQPFTIPSASMEPGLLIGDYLVVSKHAYGWSRASLPVNLPLPTGRLFGRLPERGDVVVFRRPSNPREIWIKRVVGLPGDAISVHDGVVSVNGRALTRRSLGPGIDPDATDRPVERVEERLENGRAYVTFDGGHQMAGDDRPTRLVPPGQLFVMGDNRDNSLDSRWPADLGVGLLPVSNLLGRAEIIVASWQPGAALWKPWTWFKLRSGRGLEPII